MDISSNSAVSRYDLQAMQIHIDSELQKLRHEMTMELLKFGLWAFIIGIYLWFFALIVLGSAIKNI